MTGGVSPSGHPREREPSSSFWADLTVVVTGGAGFLGSRVVERLVGLGCGRVVVPRKRDCDLTDVGSVHRLYADARPDVVLHLAAEVGGIGANRAAPGRFFFANLLMGVLMIEEGRRAGLNKFVQLGTICAYPNHTPVPFKESDLWGGYPEETNAPYGIAKKALLVQLQAYREQYDFNGIYLLPVNLYGPGDNFDPATSHVIPGLIRKSVDALEDGSKEIVVWGSGEPSREFLHVDDCARGILLAAEYYDAPDPVNLGTGEEIRIKDLAAMIQRFVGAEAHLVFDQTRPDGQPRRCLNTERALASFGFRARVPFEDGLKETIRWYRELRGNG